jgi:hypothetical protein
MKKQLLSLLLLMPLVSFAQNAPTPAEADKIRNELEILLRQRNEVKERARAEIIDNFRKAAESSGGARSIFEEAIRDTQFAGRSGQLQDMVDWRKKNEDWLRSPEFAAALQLHLDYLALTLQRASGADEMELAKRSKAYLDRLLEAEKRHFSGQGRPPREQADLLNAPVTNGVIAKQRGLDPFLTGIPGNAWELSAGNAQGILEKNIRKTLRDKKDPALMDTWDFQIAFEQESANSSRLRHNQQTFQAQRLPSLQASRAKDLILLGQSGNALLVYLDLIRKNPQHPEFESWVSSALELLPQEASPAPPASSDNSAE